jgi:beta-galactosidase
MRYLFDGGWKFLETSLDTTFDDIQKIKDDFKKVEIPHDWLIYDSTDLYRDGLGWYSKDFEYEEDADKRCFITFEGIYMDSEVYVNGKSVWTWKYGYSSFTFELTDYLQKGTNNITVSVRYQSLNTRWYSGAGIYRDVWINITSETCLSNDGVYISSRPSGDDFILRIESEVSGSKADTASISAALDGVDIEELGLSEKVSIIDAPYCDYKELESGIKRYRYVNEYLVKTPKKWDPDSPNLYNIKVDLLVDGREVDEYRTRVGFRHIVLDPDKGFIINGRNIKLNGVCEHHDHGALGSAYNSKAMRRKLTMLKSMGVNAIRGTHNMVAPDVLDLMDEMGFVFISEAFDMWRKSKTTYDYARFFDDWHKRDVASWVRRDRNHACVAFWSIGNEIYDTHADEDGQRITRELSDLVKEFDYNGNGRPTIGSNYMPWENAQKCADILGVAGYNYAEKFYDEHHKAHPDWVIYGSETSSIVQSRNIYHFPASASVLSDDDEQCSSLGNSQTSWGAKSTESCIRVDRDTPFSMGQFLWTGFDYIGEPTPYHTKNSYFGQIDTAGFPKDVFYEWQAAWTDADKAPMIHICPSYWDFNEGQTIDIRIVTNAPKAELYVNGERIGDHEFSNKPGSGSKIEWNLQIPYTKGIVEARALDTNGKVIAIDVIKSFGDAKKLCIKRPFEEGKDLIANTKDLAYLEISSLDAEGTEVANAQNRVTVTVEGAGRLVGLDNGDSSDLDSYKGNSRRLFGGKLLAIIQTTDKEGDIEVTVTGEGLEESKYNLRSVKRLEGGTEYTVKDLEDSIEYSARSDSDRGDETGSSYTKKILCYEPLEALEECSDRVINLGQKDEVPIRKLELVNESGSNIFTQDDREKVLSVNTLPENASYKDATFEAVTEFGAKSNIAELEVIDGKAVVRAKGDGRFFVRALSNNGSDKTRIISYMDFEVKGMGAAFLDPYSFVSGSMYESFEGEIGTGNDKGFATARGQKTIVTFNRLDFGRDLADEITIPVFALDEGTSRIKLWSDGEVVLDEIYDKPFMWNVYQEVTWKLKKPLTGVCDLSFETWNKLHIKGFEFKRNKRAFNEHLAVDADEIYGDTYTKEADIVSGIGNNVSLVYKDMNFGDDKPSKVTICGRARDGQNTIHILFEGEGVSTREILEAYESDDITEYTFDIGNIEGDGTITFVFLPGSNFDMKSFRFGK